MVKTQLPLPLHLIQIFPKSFYFLKVIILFQKQYFITVPPFVKGLSNMKRKEACILMLFDVFKYCDFYFNIQTVEV